MLTTKLRSVLLKEFGIPSTGLTDDDVRTLQRKHGFNELPELKKSLLKLFFAQFHDVMVYILLGAATVSVLVPYFHAGHMDTAELVDASVILLIVILNAIFGFLQEWRAENAIAMLKKLSAPTVKVRRNGFIRFISSREVVPGDIILIEAGDRLSADARLIASSSLEIDESSLTGESVPVAKAVLEKIEHGFAFSPGMLFSGTLVTRGSGEAVVTATGLSTEIGKITSLMLSYKSPKTPLELELSQTGKRIGIIVLILCVIIFVAGLLQGLPAIDIFFTVVSLAVAAVPEGLPAIATVCLAIGVQRMAKKHALIRKMDAVETLGAVTVICADKTGTMTQNKMEVQDVWTLDPEDREGALQIASSCNRAELPDIGDPTEIALLKASAESSIERLEIDEEEIPFTSEAKYMVTLHTFNGASVRYLKGAPEVIARFLDPNVATQVLVKAEEFSSKGLRVLAVAMGPVDAVKFVGLVTMIDPPRSGVHDAILLAKSAGIRTLMITGDHPATALTIARSVGIETSGVLTGVELDSLDDDTLRSRLHSVSVFARVQPAHKARILIALESMGEIICMGGDGVNDAPALKRAHVGVGMGLNGTAVAREASAMVLTDDDFSTIVSAIEEGRRIYDNIRKFVLFLMRSNAGEVMIIAGAILLQMPLPLLPLHILWINLVTDSFPALALAAEPAESGIMKRKPRKREQGIFFGEWLSLGLSAILNAVLALTVFQLSLFHFPGDIDMARTATLTTTIVYQMALAFSSRTRSSAFRVSPLQNRWLLLAVFVSLVLHVVLLLTPLRFLFSVKAIPILLWEEIMGGAILTFIVFEMYKILPERWRM